MFEVIDKRLLINNRVFSFPYPVVDVVLVEQLIVLMVEPSSGIIFNRNVYAFSDEGDFVWQIAESPHGAGDNPYVAIRLDHQNRLLACSWNGNDYLVDSKNGEITAVAFNRF